MTVVAENPTSVNGKVERRLGALLAALVFLVALNLRPALTSVGPLLPLIGTDIGLSDGMRGVLGALPLLAFAGVSPLVARLAAWAGIERTVFIALLVLVAGTVVRSYLPGAGLWLGTFVIGGAIAVGNVLVPALVKRDFAGRNVSLATGAYAACITTAAAIASATAVPLAASAGWRGALVVWGMPPLVVAVLWLSRVRRPASSNTVRTAEPTTAIWKRKTAWLVTAFMGLQSSTFYVMITWLPTIEISTGTSAAAAGVHLFLYQLVGVAAGLSIPVLMRRSDNLVTAAVTATVPTLVGIFGLLVAPALAVLWVSVAGIGGSAALVVALSLISLRGRTAADAARLSGMAQSLGYLMAAGAATLAGWMAEWTGTWQAALVLVAGLSGLQFVVALGQGTPSCASTSPVVGAYGKVDANAGHL